MSTRNGSPAAQSTRSSWKSKSRPTVALAAAGLVALAASISAQGPVVLPPLPGTATFIDWDLPVIGAGACPSAMGAVTQRPIDTPQPIDPLYYVTLCPQTDTQGRFGPSLVELRTEMHPQPAVWRAWNLGESPTPNLQDPGLLEPAAITGGVRLSTTNRVFVRTQSEMLRLDFTVTPVKITRWQDVLVDMDVAAQSDIALVNRSGGYTDAWSTHNSQTLNPGNLLAFPPTLPTLSLVPPGMVQRLTVANNSNTATITRYAVDGGAGLHYLSGIVSLNGKIYYSEGDPITDPLTGRGNGIAALDPTTGDVHRFSLSGVDPLVSGPRQLSIDASTGTIWAVTQSGHVVSFKPSSTCGNGLPNTAQITSYRIPGGVTDPRGVSPSGGTVGFTQTGFFSPVDGKKVGLLIPNKNSVNVTATQETVAKQTFTLAGTTQTVTPDTGTVQGVEKPNLPLVQTDLDGKFSQATLPDTGDYPLGIIRDPFTSKKAFYLAVAIGGTTDHRISRVQFDTDPNEVPPPPFPPPGNLNPGLVTGGGTLGTDPTAIDFGDMLTDPDAWALGGGQSNFGFVAMRNQTAGVPKGNLNFHNKFTGDKVKSVAITYFSVSGNNSTFGGTCTNDNAPLLPCSFEVTIQDNGSPGKNSDTFSISGIGFVPVQGTLTGGNIYVHRR
jgi:hypothetical protein